MKQILISGSFDDIRTADISFFKAASEKGKVTLILWSDEQHREVYKTGPRFSLAERLYFTESVKYIDQVVSIDGVFNKDELPARAFIRPASEQIWLVRKSDASPEKQRFCTGHGTGYEVCDPAAASLKKYAEKTDKSNRKNIIVTGCYDYFHTGHIRFFEEVSEHGDLYVVIGSDSNVALLKGEGHPHYKEDERLFIVQSIRFVKGAYVSTGTGWMDAEPEIMVLKPDIYAVNEDGDKPEKREFCEKHGLQYLILKRTPREGLPARSSTDLRGF